MRRFPLGPALVPLALFLLPALPAAAAPLAAPPTPAAKAAAQPAPDPAPDPRTELRLGREAYAHGDHANAAVHLARAAAVFQVTGDREALAGAYLELGRVDLVGLGEPEKALAVFLRSAEAAARPADALGWAATAADKLGLSGEARRYRERAGAAAPASADPEPPPAAAARPAADPAPGEHPEMAEMATYYLVFLRRGATWTPDETPAVRQLQEAHMANIRRLAAAGKLALAGPFLEQTGKGSLAGLYVFRVGSLDEARTVAATDPMVRSGRLVAEVYPWLGPKGLHP